MSDRRFAVRFSGEMTKEAGSALREHRMGLQHSDTFFDEPVPYSTTVVLLAEDEGDAVAQVRGALEGMGEFSGFAATELSPRRDD
jgi:hypothetical protein